MQIKRTIEMEQPAHPKIGDIVIKTRGMDKNKIGLVVMVFNSQRLGNSTVLSVVSEGEQKNWASHLTEVINENR